MKLKYKNTYLTVTKLISSNTTSGIVYQTNNNKLVVKFIIITDASNASQFVRERDIGSKLNSNHATTVRYSGYLEASDISLNLLKKRNPKKYIVGYLIMDNLVQNKSQFSLSLEEYLDKYKYIWKACPSRFHPLYKMLKKSLQHLYSVGYYHGDLHHSNIYIIVDKNYTLKYVKIIDFGQSRKLNKNLRSSCLTSSLKEIKKEFRYFKSRIGKHLGTIVKYNKNGNPFRSNNNMLKTFGPVFKYNYLASIPRTF